MLHNMLYADLFPKQRGFLPELDSDAANLFTASERLIQEHMKKYKTGNAELKDLIQQVLHHPDFNPNDVDHDMHERLMRAIEDGDIEVIDLWEEGDGQQDVRLYKRPALKVLRELLSDQRLSGHQHFGFQEYKNSKGSRILACDANGSVTFQMAQISVGPGKVPISIVLYIDGTFIKRGIPIRPVYRKLHNILYTMLSNMLCHLTGKYLLAVGSLNNDRTVMARTYAWRPLACLPILKGSACTNTSKDWQAYRRSALYHSAMAPIVAEVNEICSTDRHFRFADKVVRCGRGFWHLLSLDGAEIAAATTCGTDNCPTCECPKDRLADTDETWPLRTVRDLKKAVDDARATLLNADGTVKNGKIGQVFRYITCYIACYIACCITYTTMQVEATEKKLKHKLRPYNAFLKADGLDYPAACPREELHQFLIGLYGDYIIPSTLYEYHKVLRSPDLVMSKPGAKITQNLVSNEMLAGVWARLRDRLSSVDSSDSMVHVTQDYAAHFYDMYIDKHTGKHLTGDRVRILLLLLPFLLRDLIAPEVSMAI